MGEVFVAGAERAEFPGFRVLRPVKTAPGGEEDGSRRTRTNHGGSQEGGMGVYWSRFGSQNGNSCAGINRHEAENARVLRERGSDPLGLEFCVRCREVSGEA